MNTTGKTCLCGRPAIATFTHGSGPVCARCHRIEQMLITERKEHRRGYYHAERHGEYANTLVRAVRIAYTKLCQRDPRYT